MKDLSAAPRSARSAASGRSWRVVDIVVASVLAVAVGVVFWAWSLGYAGISALTAAFPPLAGLYTGGWLIAGVLGGLIIRKPGAAVYCEMLAAAVSGVLGTQFGLSVLLSGFLQGLGAELVFLLFLYRRFTLPVALLAGLGSGLFLGLSENVLYNVEWAAQWQLLYVLLTAVSGAVLAGGLSWLAVRALARTGALAPFASGRTGQA
ncbi:MULTISPECIES: ECF transporter S component [unclassified Arthrobacter]|uniref:ECF transporter S component n=1 Tax=unclassified Arthrobacter TaxID=235627 RepID=UPI001E64D51C|nr:MULTISPECIES: ECF transporter S component [unclassified Arthrobacter]MCC9144666.1 ECF transporter S component [Arthrobacter sp. zg-Y919]MDK1275892.1 ECF transporter S component [Arthrobacter sp. zg.Y919]WIB02750.1 ECF transporter S component [Arthrobacter sp. zg-Y919]